MLKNNNKRTYNYAVQQEKIILLEFRQTCKFHGGIHSSIYFNLVSHYYALQNSRNKRICYYFRIHITSCIIKRNLYYSTPTAHEHTHEKKNCRTVEPSTSHSLKNLFPNLWNSNEHTEHCTVSMAFNNVYILYF